ncbi:MULTISPECIES: TolC family protein [Psychrilyobacter]|uniref:TolC family protein n=1 Tax=Psychrilyobacter TaxID=623282 RepID=UPI0013144C74|nr:MULTISPECIES: TolC family protein [Psychrilyobacter]MCS5421568.1 TolC family protein [Psychrilyobacter sp. S5]NDI78586.1 TolC family protein [Psychrilyobacter piezotolerans]
MIKKISLIILLFVISVCTFAKEAVNIAVLYSQKSSNNMKNSQSIMEKEFTAVLEGSYNAVFPKEYQIIAESGKEEIEKRYNELVADRGVDVIVGGDFIVSNVILGKKKIKKLSIMPFAQYIYHGETSGVENLTYSVQPVGFKKIFQLLKSVEGDFSEITLIAPEELLKADERIIPFVEKQIKENGISKIKWAAFNGDYEKLAADVKGQKVALLGGFSDKEEFIQIMDVLNNEKIVTYADGYGTGVSDQAYLSFEVDTNIQKRLRKSAISLLEILDGGSAKNQKVYLVGGELRPVINQSVAEKIGKWPNWRTTVSAKVVGEKSLGKELTLYSSIRKGLEDNLQLTIDKNDLNIQEYQVDAVQSSRLPQIKAAGGYKVVDQGQADAPNDVKKENTYVGVGLRQVIFNDKLNSAVSVEKSVFNAEKESYKQSELDTILTVSTAYFNVLKLKASESIQYSNLELTKKNLELARVREKVGYSRKSDVYRWESKLATDISKLTDSQAKLKNAKEGLMRILNNELDTNFQPVDILDTEEFLGIAGLELTKKNVMDDTLDKLMKLGLENSTEIKQIDSYMDAAERRLKEADRNFYAPEVALTANYNYYMDRSGSGNLYSNPADSDPRKEAWTVGIEVSIPLLEGGERIAKRNTATEQLQKLTTQKEDVENSVKQNIRASLTDLVTAKINVETSKDARVAADKTLELVTDSYSRGEVSITELLDSQNVAIQAKETESASKYDYYTKLMITERAVGVYHLLDPEAYFELLGETNLKVQ